MNNVPNMISTKDLSYISDMFEWMATEAKKANHFSNEVKDEAVKEKLKAVATMHAKHCQKLLDILNQGGKE
ncbi:MAG: spore coat protein [Ignavibacteriales bacterium]